MNSRLGEAKFNLLSLLLYPREGFSIKQIPIRSARLHNGVTSIQLYNEVIKWLHNINATKSVLWNFNADESQGHHRHDRILGHYILPKPNMELSFSNITIEENWGAYEGSNYPKWH